MRTRSITVRQRFSWAVLPAVLALSGGLLAFGTGVAGASGRAPSIQAGARLPAAGDAPSAALAPWLVPHESFKGVDIISGGHKIKAGGSTWYLTVAAFGTSSSASVYLDLTRPISKTSYEAHEWSVYDLSPKSLSSPAKGTFKVDPPKTATSPLMFVNVTFKKKTSSAVACKSGSETDYGGTVSGTVELVTGFRKLGTVGSKIKVISFGSSSIAIVENNCVPKTSPPPPCSRGYGVSASGTGHNPAFFSATSTSRSDTMTLDRYVALSKPKHAFRFDFVTARDPAITRSGTTLNITTSPGSAITGSAKVGLTGTSSKSNFRCKVGTTNHTETIQTYLAPTFTNHDLVGHMLVPGPVTLGSPVSFSSVVIDSY